MKFKSLHPNFIPPTRGSEAAGGWDLYMPEAGYCYDLHAEKVPLGFAAEVPEGHVALLLPRSGAGAKYGLELNNTCGVIDADYRGEWIAVLRTKGIGGFDWEAGDRVIQMVIVPVADITIEVVEELSETTRGAGGFGASGK